MPSVVQSLLRKLRYDSQYDNTNGGVGLYIKDSLTFNQRNDLQSCTNEFETVWVEIGNTNDKNFLICCVYRHSNSNIDSLTVHFQNVLSKLTSNKLFVMGDININLLEYASHTPKCDFVNNFYHKHVTLSINLDALIWHLSRAVKA